MIVQPIGRRETNCRKKSSARDLCVKYDIETHCISIIVIKSSVHVVAGAVMSLSELRRDDIGRVYLISYALVVRSREREREKVQILSTVKICPCSQLSLLRSRMCTFGCAHIDDDTISDL